MHLIEKSLDKTTFTAYKWLVLKYNIDFRLLIYYTISDEDDMPKTLFCFEFEDKDGKIYKQYVVEVSVMVSIDVFTLLCSFFNKK